MQVTRDFVSQVNQVISTFRADAVQIGIPQAENDRKRGEGDELPKEFGNAAILALNHFGNEELHIPPRPVLPIAIKRATPAIVEQMKAAALAALSGGANVLSTYYNRVGIIASTEAKKVINDQDGIAAPAEATLASRKRRKFKGEKALLVTGQMRNAITYVVDGE